MSVSCRAEAAVVCCRPNTCILKRRDSLISRRRTPYRGDNFFTTGEEICKNQTALQSGWSALKDIMVLRMAQVILSSILVVIAIVATTFANQIDIVMIPKYEQDNFKLMELGARIS